MTGTPRVPSSGSELTKRPAPRGPLGRRSIARKDTEAPFRKTARVLTAIASDRMSAASPRSRHGSIRSQGRSCLDIVRSLHPGRGSLRGQTPAPSCSPCSPITPPDVWGTPPSGPSPTPPGAPPHRQGPWGPAVPARGSAAPSPAPSPVPSQGRPAVMSPPLFFHSRSAAPSPAPSHSRSAAPSPGPFHSRSAAPSPTPMSAPSPRVWIQRRHSIAEGRLSSKLRGAATRNGGPTAVPASGRRGSSANPQLLKYLMQGESVRDGLARGGRADGGGWDGGPPGHAEAPGEEATLPELLQKGFDETLVILKQAELPESRARRFRASLQQAAAAIRDALREASSLQQQQRQRHAPDTRQQQHHHHQQRADDDPAGAERAPRDSGSAEEGVGVPAATPKVQSGVRWGPGNPLSCPLCRGMLSEPVSAMCGHAFCRRCLEQEPSGECAACRRPFQLLDVREHRPNIVACKLLLKWFPRESEAARMRHEALELLQEGRVMLALAKCQAAMELAPGDSALLCVRARCHAATGHWEAALLDAENVCRLEPTWHQGFLTKGHSQEALGLREDALTAFLHCLALRPNCVEVKACVDKLLAELLSPALQRSPLDFLQRELGRPPIASGTASGTTTASTTTSSSSSGELTLGKAAPEKEATSADHSLRSSLPLPVQDGAGCSEEEEEEVDDGRASLVDEVPLQKRLKRKCSVEEEEEGPEEEDGTGRSLLSLGRPRKLLKRYSASEWGTSPALSAVPPALIDPTDMECSLCMRLLYEPVTTPCGHSFCLRCLERCLDHNPRCPLCKETLAQYLALQRYSASHLLEELAARYMAEALAERRSAHLDEIAEMSSLTQDVPVFVCTVAFPSLPCPLHVFEPRYRLMVRRCLETGTRRFGMCLGNASGFAEFGCMLGVQSAQLMPDGRSVVYTVGERRFRVVQRSHRDGYNTANIEYLEDVKVEEEEAYTELQALHEEVYVQAAAWFGSLRSRLRSQVLLHFGTLPAKEADLQASVDGPAWCWWLLAVLPLDGQAQLKVLAMTSLHDRLRALSRVLAYVSGRSR
ncbi:unnamed protein product [Lampetra fluviatilis]